MLRFKPLKQAWRGKQGTRAQWPFECWCTLLRFASLLVISRPVKVTCPRGIVITMTSPGEFNSQWYSWYCSFVHYKCTEDTLYAISASKWRIELNCITDSCSRENWRDYSGWAIVNNNSEISVWFNIFRSPQGSQLSSHDYVFWCGDFNYRIDMPNAQTKELVKERAWSELMSNDQLVVQKAEGKVVC